MFYVWVLIFFAIILSYFFRSCMLFMFSKVKYIQIDKHKNTQVHLDLLHFVQTLTDPFLRLPFRQTPKVNNFRTQNRSFISLDIFFFWISAGSHLNLLHSWVDSSERPETFITGFLITFRAHSYCCVRHVDSFRSPGTISGVSRLTFIKLIHDIRTPEKNSWHAPVGIPQGSCFFPDELI